MQQIKITGIKNIAGVQFTGIEGGFGEGKKSMLVKDIATNHGRELKHVNELINKNRKRFKDDVDIIDCLSRSERLRIIAEENGWIGSNRTQNVYILSERGYAKLLKILEDDLAWELYDKLVDGYFNMRANHVNTDPMSIMRTQFQVLEKHDEKIIYLENEVTDLKDSLPLLPLECDAVSAEVRRRGIKLMNGKESHAYQDSSLRGKVYSALYKQLKTEFNVSSYKAIKRKNYEIAISLVKELHLPYHLREELERVNSQLNLDIA